nr:cytochrome C [Desulfobulbaceae bacterium]
MLGKRTYLEAVAKLVVFGAICFVFGGCVQPHPSKTSEMDPGQPAMSSSEQALLEIQSGAELVNTDCNKCHNAQPADINRNGAKHKTAIGCLDCHIEHLPLGKATIPQCSMCHDGAENEHFKLVNCLGCHRNPHTPLDVTVDDLPDNSSACKTCHTDKGEEFAQFPSKHADKNCTHCHPTKHKVINKCMTCHEPHAAFMVYEDCLRCHQPHSPLNIKYADDTPNKFCGACHTELFTMLSASKAKHGELACVFCHKTQHPTVPNCAACHGNPHDNTILNPFNDDCLKCHRNPHDLIY